MKKIVRLLLAVAALSGAAAFGAPKAAPDAAGLYAGSRGVSLPLRGSQLVFLKKGDRVDVVVTYEEKTLGVSQKVSATLVQNVLVTALSRPGKIEDAGTVQLLLTPEQAQEVALSQAKGIVTLLVRAPGDGGTHALEVASFSKLFH